MKILFDGSILGYSRLKAQYRTGIFQVALALVRALSQKKDLEIEVYSSSGNQFLVKQVLVAEGLESVPVVGSRFWGGLGFGFTLARNLTWRRGWRGLSGRFARAVDAIQGQRARVDQRVLASADWYFSPMEAIPAFVRETPRLGVALVVHDLIPLVLEDYKQDTSDPTRWFPKLVQDLRPTDTVFTVSQFTKDDLVRLFPALAAAPIVVAPNAIDRERFPVGSPEGVSSFFLTVSTVEPRKRMDTIARAFSRYRASGGTAELVICGANRQGHQDHVLQHLRPEDRPSVRFTGYLPDEALPPLYQRCLAFVYVSEYEGFGLPVLEAMSCGAPVIVSDRTSLPEVAGQAGVVVSPDDAETLAGHFNRLEADPQWRATLREKSLKQADAFSWEKTAAIIAGALG